jgi:hypothetical protein
LSAALVPTPAAAQSCVRIKNLANGMYLYEDTSISGCHIHRRLLRRTSLAPLIQSTGGLITHRATRSTLAGYC